MSRPFDVVLFGATGFVGRLAAEHLAATAGLRWAVAGRDDTALRQLAGELSTRHPDRDAPGVVVADLAHSGSLAALAASARVVVTTVGPYAEGGLAVVEACVAAGTHDLDLTGEPAVVRESRHRFDARAREARVRIVHCVGFESVPADLGTFETVRRLPSGPRDVRCYVRARGRVSGGTWASFVSALSRGMGDERMPRLRGGGRSGARPLLHRPPPEVGGWAVPVPIIDPAVVRESARLRPDLYGPDFTYAQFFVFSSWAWLARVGVTVGGAFVLAQAEPTRRWLLDRVPRGTGPDAATRARSWFEVTCLGSGGGEQVVTRVSGGDPGYGDTSVMLATAATLLGTREPELPPAYGVLTPAAALGEPYVAALHAAGIRFETLPPPR
jgi:short subunit dehydrogenase-like uncharacterized protein